MTGNADLAERARANANRAAQGSPARRAWLCVAVCLATTTTLKAARKATADIPSDAVRDDARRLIGQLASEE